VNRKILREPLGDADNLTTKRCKLGLDRLAFDPA
jgi:hypothetical protein